MHLPSLPGSVVLLLLCAVLSSNPWVASCTKIRGSLNYDQSNGQQPIIYLERYGVGKGQEVYAYGNLKRDPDELLSFNSPMLLAFLPQSLWDEFYGKVRSGGEHNQCDHLMTTVLNDSILMEDSRCVSNGTQDNLRKVPCNHPNGDFTTCNQPNSVSPIPWADVTFHIPSAPKAEFYYMFLITCTRNLSRDNPCEWRETDKLVMDYNISVVNNRPNETNHYTSEFPYDLQGTLTIQLFFSLLYISLITVHFLLHSRLCVRKSRYKLHFLVKVFTLSLVLEFLYVLLELLHYSVYAANGIGVVAFKYIGEVANQFSDWLLILVVILVGKGWQVTTSSLRWSKVTIIIWGAYIFFSAAYFIWMVISEQVFPLSVSLFYGYQSYVGGFYLGYRVFILVYLLYEMRQVYQIENRPTALALYIIVAVCYVIWFCYLPLLTLFALLTDPVRRLVVMLSVYLVFDFLINLGMVVLFCPKWEDKFFQFDNYINSLTDSKYVYKSLKSYGNTASPI